MKNFIFRSIDIALCTGIGLLFIALFISSVYLYYSGMGYVIAGNLYVGLSCSVIGLICMMLTANLIIAWASDVITTIGKIRRLNNDNNES